MGEVLLILVIALIFIGPKKLPELAKSLGKGIREFQKAKDQVFSDIASEVPKIETSSEIKKNNTIDVTTEKKSDV